MQRPLSNFHAQHSHLSCHSVKEGSPASTDVLTVKEEDLPLKILEMLAGVPQGHTH